MRAFRALFSCCAPRDSEKDKNENEEKEDNIDLIKLKKPSNETHENSKVNTDEETQKNLSKEEAKKKDTVISEEDIDNNKIIFESRLIRQDEKDFITFVYKNIIYSQKKV
jgi:hypothetical protein